MADPQTLHILKTSKDAREVARAAQTLGVSREAEDHELLRRMLGDEAFLNRLDAPDADEQYTDLRVVKPIRSLSQNPAPSAHAALISLMDDETFCAIPPRIDVLIDATELIRPPGDRVIKFWDKHVEPEGEHTEIVARVCVDNGTEPALKYFETIVVDPDHEYETRRAWLRQQVFLKRNEEPVLLMCERLAINAKTPLEIRGDVIDVVYDYRPQEWYRAHLVLSPPPRAGASGKSIEVLRRLGAYAIDTMKVSPAREEAVKSTLRELDALGATKTRK
jgi:hypothetical protein